MNAPLRLPAIAEILAHEDEMVAIRHQIHSNPELARISAIAGSRKAAFMGCLWVRGSWHYAPLRACDFLGWRGQTAGDIT